MDASYKQKIRDAAHSTGEPRPLHTRPFPVVYDAQGCYVGPRQRLYPVVYTTVCTCGRGLDEKRQPYCVQHRTRDEKGGAP